MTKFSIYKTSGAVYELAVVERMDPQKVIHKTLQVVRIDTKDPHRMPHPGRVRMNLDDIQAAQDRLDNKADFKGWRWLGENVTLPRVRRISGVYVFQEGSQL